MRSMFVQLFFWFGIAMALSGIVFFLLAFTMRIGPLQEHFEQRFSDERNRIHRDALEFYGRGVASVFERYGTSAAIHFRDGNAPHGMHIYLFTAEGTPISNDAPLPVRKAVRGIALTSGKEVVLEKGKTVVAVRVKSPRGVTYLAAAEDTIPPRPPRKPPPMAIFPPDIWSRFIVSLVVGGMVCYVLAWRLTSPVRKLRAAAQRLGTGDFTSRVSIGARGRGDEIADLVRDFNRMAERIERLVTAQRQLVRDISHELRSPLARLSVALGLARREAPPSTVAALDRIERETERLNRMIGELLTLSLLESGSERFEKADFDLTELVEEVARDADFEAAAGNRSVLFHPDGPLLVTGNREMMRRALENVMRNGVRYTDEGTAVEVTLEREGSLGAEIRVRDHGPGLPQEELTEIFRPFYRYAEARDRQSGGTGIGLAITERAVRLHAGEVWAANARNGGLVVTIRLPLSSEG
ncbi:MAG: HAMP domain-containing protein [Geobacteraceae bacterium]|nr:HAMP domain-containing protein [Geobacteraceae bacterium]